MQQKEIEKFAFLYLCGQRDRDILARKEKMTFQDFDRLVYISDFLGFCQMSLEIWNQFFSQFAERFRIKEESLEENGRNGEVLEGADDIQLYDGWLAQFWENIPDYEARESLADIMKQ